MVGGAAEGCGWAAVGAMARIVTQAGWWPGGCAGEFNLRLRGVRPLWVAGCAREPVCARMSGWATPSAL